MGEWAAGLTRGAGVGSAEVSRVGGLEAVLGVRAAVGVGRADGGALVLDLHAELCERAAHLIRGASLAVGAGHLGGLEAVLGVRAAVGAVVTSCTGSGTVGAHQDTEVCERAAGGTVLTVTRLAEHSGVNRREAVLGVRAAVGVAGAHRLGHAGDTNLDAEVGQPAAGLISSACVRLVEAGDVGRGQAVQSLRAAELGLTTPNHSADQGSEQKCLHHF